MSGRSDEADARGSEMEGGRGEAGQAAAEEAESRPAANDGTGHKDGAAAPLRAKQGTPEPGTTVTLSNMDALLAAVGGEDRQPGREPAPDQRGPRGDSTNDLAPPAGTQQNSPNPPVAPLTTAPGLPGTPDSQRLAAKVEVEDEPASKAGAAVRGQASPPSSAGPSATTDAAIPDSAPANDQDGTSIYVLDEGMARLAPAEARAPAPNSADGGSNPQPQLTGHSQTPAGVPAGGLEGASSAGMQQNSSLPGQQPSQMPHAAPFGGLGTGPTPSALSPTSPGTTPDPSNPASSVQSSAPGSARPDAGGRWEPDRRWTEPMGQQQQQGPGAQSAPVPQQQQQGVGVGIAPAGGSPYRPMGPSASAPPYSSYGWAGYGQQQPQPQQQQQSPYPFPQLPGLPQAPPPGYYPGSGMPPSQSPYGYGYSAPPPLLPHAGGTPYGQTPMGAYPPQQAFAPQYGAPNPYANQGYPPVPGYAGGPMYPPSAYPPASAAYSPYPPQQPGYYPPPYGHPYYSQPPPHSRPGNPLELEAAREYRTSCEYCTLRRRKCISDGLPPNPCMRCKRDGLQCVYLKVKKRGPKAKGILLEAQQQAMAAAALQQVQQTQVQQQQLAPQQMPQQQQPQGGPYQQMPPMPRPPGL